MPPRIHVPAFAGAAIAPVIATTEIAATTARRMSPFIEKVPSIGLPAPKVGASASRHDQTGV